MREVLTQMERALEMARGKLAQAQEKLDLAIALTAKRDRSPEEQAQVNAAQRGRFKAAARVDTLQAAVLVLEEMSSEASSLDEEAGEDRT